MRDLYLLTSRVALCCVLAGFFTLFLGIGNTEEKTDRKIQPYPVKSQTMFERRTGPEGDLYGNIDPARALSLDDLNLLLRLTEFLMNRSNDDFWRKAAAEDLGRLGHQYALPALLAVFRNKEDPARGACLSALSQVADKRVVDFMIDEALLDKDASVALHTDFLLTMLTHYQHGQAGFHELPPDHAVRRSHQELWRRWWKKNRKRVEPDRNAAGVIY